MNCRLFLTFIISLFLLSCNQMIVNKTTKKDFKIGKKYNNTGFALIYDNQLKGIKKLEERSMNIYHRTLKKGSKVKITNLNNGNSTVAEVKSNKIKFSSFYNSVLSLRISEILELNISEPYVKISLITNNSTFIAKKAKTFEEERSVAEKAPIDGIDISDLNRVSTKKKELKNNLFSYSIKVADFYFKESADTMFKRIKNKTLINNLNIVKLSDTKYRLLIGPFNDIKTLKNSFEKMKSFNFENLEILKNA